MVPNHQPDIICSRKWISLCKVFLCENTGASPSDSQTCRSLSDGVGNIHWNWIPDSSHEQSLEPYLTGAKRRERGLLGLLEIILVGQWIIPEISRRLAPVNCYMDPFLTNYQV
jgi:hypothetical protein